MEIRFEKPSMKYKAGQWVFLCVPEVSTFQVSTRVFDCTR